MLEAHILTHIIDCESRSMLKEGRVTGWSLAHIQKRHGVPKSTFYRAVNCLLSQGLINRQKRGYYTLTHDMRASCNGVPSAEKVRS